MQMNTEFISTYTRLLPRLTRQMKDISCFPNTLRLTDPKYPQKRGDSGVDIGFCLWGR